MRPFFQSVSFPCRRLVKKAIKQGIALCSVMLVPLSGMGAEYINDQITSSAMLQGDSTYRLNAGISRDFGSNTLYVGYYADRSNTSLFIEEGANITYGGRAILGYRSNNNSLTVTGEGSLFKHVYEESGSYFTIGSQGGSRNSLLVEKEGSIEGAYLAGGNSNASHQNSITIDGTGSSASFQMSVSVGSSDYDASENKLIVRNGAHLSAGSISVGRGGTDNTALITGSETEVIIGTVGLRIGGATSLNSKFTLSDGALAMSGISHRSFIEIGANSSVNSELLITGANTQFNHAGYFTIGKDSSSDSFLTIEDGGLMRLGNSDIFGDLAFGSGSEAFVRLDQGYFAWFGDRTEYLTEYIGEGLFQYWDEGTETWISGAIEDFTMTYLSDLDGSTLTGGRYSNLQGYTLVFASIPEPSFWVLSSLAMGAIILLRRPRRRNFS